MLIFIWTLNFVSGFTECVDAKSNGTQKEYCESRLLNSSGSSATIACYVNFCDYCCQPYSNTDCLNVCRSTHISKPSKSDPEDIFIKVCSSEKMRDAMKPYCEKYNSVDEDKMKCFNSFCYDCCSGELKITSDTDFEMQKCIKYCTKNIQGDPQKNCTESDSNKYCTKFFDPSSTDSRLKSIHSCLENYCDVCCGENNDCLSTCKVENNSTNGEIVDTIPKETLKTSNAITSACYEFIDDMLELNRCQFDICNGYCQNDFSCTKICLKSSEGTRGDAKLSRIIDVKTSLNLSKVSIDFLLEGPLENKITKLKQEIEKYKHYLLKAQKELNSLQRQKQLEFSKSETKL